MKKAVSMFLAAALAVGTFAGCGSSADTGSTGSAASTESGSTDSAADGSVFKIGGIGPTTGAAAIYGSAVMNAAQIAVDEINEAGGINGYQVEFKAEDDQSDAEKSVNAYNSLKDWGMQVLMGTVTTTPCIAVADKTAEDGMFEITPSASSTDVIENDNVFQACFTDPNLGTASAQQQIRDLRLSQRKLSQQIPRQTSPHSYRKHRVKVLIWYSFQSTIQRLPSF